MFRIFNPGRKIQKSEVQRPPFPHMHRMLKPRVDERITNGDSRPGREIILDVIRDHNFGELKTHKIHPDERDAIRNYYLISDESREEIRGHDSKYKAERSGDPLSKQSALMCVL